MKLFLLLLTTCFLHPSDNASLEVAGAATKCFVEANIENLIVNYDDDCNGFNWSIVICNNSQYCRSYAGFVNVSIEYCPFDGELFREHFPSLPPRTCVRVSGHLPQSCGTVCIRAKIENSEQEELNDCRSC